MKPFINVDESLSLHLARHELAGAIFQAVDENRAFLRQWLPWVDGTRSLEDTKTFITESMRHNSDGSRLTLFIMSNGQLAGSLGVVHFNKDHRRCEIGYWLREDLQGQGIMTRSFAAFIEFLFQKKQMNRLEVLIIPGNNKSRAVALRLGFMSDGVLRKALQMYGIFHDVEVLGLLKSDWMAGKGF
ncbi:MAG: GNAT family N-acetyltransferase [Bacteroidetes bacterium]|nr:GNAT family N-acetyltransferase [Bacteroidota bacterium]